jgi:hypothetical protein
MSIANIMDVRLQLHVCREVPFATTTLLFIFITSEICLMLLFMLHVTSVADPSG